VNAMLNSAVGQLAIGELAASETERIAREQNLLWIDFSKIPLVGYRTEDKKANGRNYKRGQEIAIYPLGVALPEGIQIATFDPEHLYITCKLQSKL